MSLIGVLTLCALVVMASATRTDKVYYDEEKAPELFAQFMKDFNRTYKDDADRDVHYAAFVTNLKKVNEMNKSNPHATFGINKFADYTPEEYKSMTGFRIKDKKQDTAN